MCSNLLKLSLIRVDAVIFRVENLGRNKPGARLGWGRNKDLWPEYTSL